MCDECPGYAAPGCCLRPHMIAENLSMMSEKLRALEMDRAALLNAKPVNRQQRRAAKSKARNPNR